MAQPNDLGSTRAVPDQATLFRAAVKSVGRCLEIGKESPEMIDSFCSGLLLVVKGPNPDEGIKKFRESYQRLPKKDLYLSAVIKALDCKSEEEAELEVLASVNAHFLNLHTKGK